MTGEQLDTALWYLGRGTGVMALLLLTVSVALGVGARAGRPIGPLPRFAVTAVHRNASLLASVLLLVHVLSLQLDPQAQLRIVDLVLPFAGSYRPFWLGLGTLAFDLLLAVALTSLLRRRIGARTWRAVHWLGYACWPVALVHAIGTGTDSATVWLRVLAVLSFTVVAGSAIYRLMSVNDPQEVPR